MEKETRRAKALQKKAEGKGDRGQNATFVSNAASLPGEKKSQSGMLLDIEEVIEQNDKAEEERQRIESARIWEENEGLLSGEMV